VLLILYQFIAAEPDTLTCPKGPGFSGPNKKGATPRGHGFGLTLKGLIIKT
jgi:hypothetical protein